MPGYPIRTPWDHSSVDSSPRPIAASHVLHRLLVPRHPPSALDNLTTKMLASTVQFSTNDQPTTHHPTPDHHTHPTNGAQRNAVCKARSRLAVTPERQPPPPTSPHHHGQEPTTQRWPWLFSQDPTGCQHLPPTQPAQLSTAHQPVNAYSPDQPQPVTNFASVSAVRAPPPPHSDGTGPMDHHSGHGRSLERR